MGLYRVIIEFETVIMADTEADAVRSAEGIIRDDADDPAKSVSAQEIADVDDLPEGWSTICRPWGEGNHDDKTVGQLIEEKSHE